MSLRHDDELAVEPIRMLPSNPVVSGEVIIPCEIMGGSPRGVARLQDDAVAHFEARHAIPKLEHLPCSVTARDHRQRQRHAWHPATHPEVEVIHAHREDAAQDLTRARGRVRQIDDLEDLRPSVLMNLDSLHLYSPLKVGLRFSTKARIPS